MDQYKLIIDTREKAVICHKDAFTHITTEIAQITVGDYAIMQGEKLVAVFERKTYPDYGASLKDGRHQNKEKLLAVRQKTNCRVFYIIEGHAKENGVYSGIPYHHIKSSIFHLQLRDAISMVYTESEYDTAKTLADFVEHAKTIKGDWCVIGGSATDSNAEPIFVPGGERTLLFETHAKDIATTVRNMWAKFRGITVANAHTFMEKWSIFEGMRGIDATQVGHKVSKMVKDSTLKPDTKTITNIFAEIPGISKMTAVRYAELFRANPDSFATVELLEPLKLPGVLKKDGKMTKDKKIGVKAALIIQLIHHKTEA